MLSQCEFLEFLQQGQEIIESGRSGVVCAEDGSFATILHFVTMQRKVVVVVESVEIGAEL